jgi:hypothetical protein
MFGRVRRRVRRALTPTEAKPWARPKLVDIARLLPAGEVTIERLTLELKAGGQSLDNAGESGAVRLAGRDQLQRHRFVGR